MFVVTCKLANRASALFRPADSGLAMQVTALPFNQKHSPQKFFATMLQ